MFDSMIGEIFMGIMLKVYSFLGVEGLCDLNWMLIWIIVFDFDVLDNIIVLVMMCVVVEENDYLLLELFCLFDFDFE